MVRRDIGCPGANRSESFVIFACYPANTARS